MSNKYRSVTIDRNLLESVDSILDENNYSSRAEFVKDAIRRRLESLKKEEIST